MYFYYQRVKKGFMRNIVLAFVAVMISFVTVAQNTTTGDSQSSGLTNQGSVLIVPFETKMYFSDIDRDISQKNRIKFSSN